MNRCQMCGSTNRTGAKFCIQCGAALVAAYDTPTFGVPQITTPTLNDTEWLAATLTATPASPLQQQVLMEEPSLPIAIVADQGASMEQPQPAKSNLFADRYEIVSQEGESVVVLDRQPWLRCWSCAASTNEAGEIFCTQCGAALEGRKYQGQLNTNERSGNGLVPAVINTSAREMLPEIWDQLQDGEQTLTIAAESTRAPISPPVEELDALYIGRGLAQLLQILHNEGLALGGVAATDIEINPARQPRIRNAASLARLTQPAQAEHDVRELATLLEELTSTPRTTRRLDEASIPEAPEPGLDDILRAVRTGSITTPTALAERLDTLITSKSHPQPLRTLIGSATHQGMVRELDEDSLFYTELRIARKAAPQTWGLYIVADGMGGHSAGEVASDLAIRGAYAVVQNSYMAPTIDGNLPDEENRLKEIVRSSILRANEYVLREAQQRGNDMGTTITMALVAGDRAIVGNVGDSRTYLLRGGELKRVSKDHSLVQRLVDLGQIGPDDVYTHPQRSAVLRSLGDKADVNVDVFTVRLKAGDILLLCSDGLWEMVRDPKIKSILSDNPDPQVAADFLITEANKAGGDDNITVIVARFEAYP
jgi:PPM family protein phosphatase